MRSPASLGQEAVGLPNWARPVYQRHTGGPMLANYKWARNPARSAHRGPSVRETAGISLCTDRVPAPVGTPSPLLTFPIFGEVERKNAS
jgi:hypothetical protein